MKNFPIKKNPKNASAIIIFYKKKILLNLRSNKKRIFYANHWGLLGGAKEKNENYQSCALREFEEETSIKILKKKLIFFNRINFTFPNKPKKIIYRNYYKYQIENLIYFKNFFYLNEGLDSKFFNYEQIKKIKKIVPYDKLVIDMFFSSFKNSK